MMSIEKPALDNAIRVLQVLGAEPLAQAHLFPAGACIADEIALDLHDALLFLEQEAEREAVAEAVVMEIARIDRVLMELSGPQEPRFWSVEGLNTDIRWEQLRTMARKILGSLGEAIGPPTIDNVRPFVRTDREESS